MNKPDDSLITICTLNDPMRAEILRAKLESQGINCYLLGESQAGFAGVLDIQLAVAKEDVPSAQAAISEDLGEELPPNGSLDPADEI